MDILGIYTSVQLIPMSGLGIGIPGSCIQRGGPSLLPSWNPDMSHMQFILWSERNPWNPADEIVACCPPGKFLMVKHEATSEDSRNGSLVYGVIRSQYSFGPTSSNVQKETNSWSYTGDTLCQLSYQCMVIWIYLNWWIQTCLLGKMSNLADVVVAAALNI